MRDLTDGTLAFSVRGVSSLSSGIVFISDNETAHLFDTKPDGG